MKRPAFQFYPADWRNNAKLRRCSHAARGAWIDLLCLFHDSDEYGILRWPLADISQAAGVPMALLLELSRKDVLKGADSGCDALVFRPVHGRTKGDAVTLIASSDAPCWYSSRMVVDEYKRGRMGAATRYQAAPSQAPSHSPSIAPSHRQGDGSTSSSSSSKQKLDATHLEPVGTGSPPFGGYQPIVDAYNEVLPTGRGQPCARASTPTIKLKKRLAAAQKLARTVCASQGWPYDPSTFWRGYFSVCAQDPWMRGDRPNPNNPEWKQNLFVLLADERLGTVIDRAIEALRGEHEPV